MIVNLRAKTSFRMEHGRKKKAKYIVERKPLSHRQFLQFLKTTAMGVSWWVVTPSREKANKCHYLDLEINSSVNLFLAIIKRFKLIKLWSKSY